MTREKDKLLKWSGLFYNKNRAEPGSVWMKDKLMETLEGEYKDKISILEETLNECKVAGTTNGHIFAKNVLDVLCFKNIAKKAILKKQSDSRAVPAMDRIE